MRPVHLAGSKRRSRSRLFLSILVQAALVVSPLAAQQDPASSTPAAPPPAATSAQPSATVPGKNPSNRERNKAAKLYADGAKAMEAGNPRQAAEDFDQAAQLDPANHDYKFAAEIAHEHLLTQLVQEAAKARLMGNDELALSKLEEALKIDPQNMIVKQHIGELVDSTAAQNASSPYLPSDYASIQLAPQAARHDFHVRANSTEVLRQVYSAYGITALMDDSIRPQSIRLDADGVSFKKATELASLLTRTFFVPLDPTRVLIAADTRENRQKYERQYEETVYLPGMTATELSDIGNVVKNIFEAQQAVVQPQAGTLTMRAPEGTLRAVNATLTGLVEGKGQVLLEMRIFEIGRTRAQNIGIQLPQQVTAFNVPAEVQNILAQNATLVQQIIASGLAKAGDYAAIAAILIATGAISGGVLTQPFAVFGGGLTLTGVSLGTTTVNLNLNSSDSRMLDELQVRVGDQEAATFRSGTRYPIVTALYSSSSIAGAIPGLNTPGLSSTLQNLGINLPAAGVSQNTPQFQYEDLGLTLKATPRIQRSREVTLLLDMKVDALSGATVNGNPVLNNRQYTGTITVRDGDTAVLLSNLNRQESRAVNGIPGFSEVPGFRSTTDVSNQVDVSNLMIMITPHIVRSRANHQEDPMVMIPRH